jgi:hypothetical protein
MSIDIEFRSDIRYFRINIKSLYLLRAFQTVEVTDKNSVSNICITNVVPKCKVTYNCTSN